MGQLITYRDWRYIGGPVVVIPVQLSEQGSLIADPPPSGGYRCIWPKPDDNKPPSPPNGGSRLVRMARASKGAAAPLLARQHFQ